MNPEDRANRFVDEIIADANSGSSFVPFVGSGLSSPSGIIMGLEFTNYLAFTTYLVLCNPKQRQRTHGEGTTRHWDLHQQGWPPLPSAHEVEQAEAWIRRQFLRLCDELSFAPNYDGTAKKGIKSLSNKSRRESSLDELMSLVSQPPIPRILRSWEAADSEEKGRQFRKLIEQSQANASPTIAWSDRSGSYSDVIVERGIRALADWRETLTFLASVRAFDGDPPRLEWGPLDTSIIDHFNAVITRDKRPNLGHKIIAHLSGPLRVSTILSTNFDTLTEDAYRALGLPISVLPVSNKGDLPHPRTAASCDALVKLHGETHDTRADMSLDDEPTEEDKAAFSAYMRRGTGHLVKGHRWQSGRFRQDRSCKLLVVGYSGSDNRCIQMMKHWLETAPGEPRIYWICFSRGDELRVNHLFSSSAYTGKISTVRTSRPDLLLYELYQRLVICQPPGGLTYEFSHALPPSRQPRYDHTAPEIQEFLKSTCTAAGEGNLVGRYDRRLLRDSMVRETVERIMEAVSHPQPQNWGVTASTFGEVSPWLPSYRFPQLYSAQTNDSAQSQLVEEATNAGLKHHPRVINSCGGVVRASAIAADELSSQQFCRVFWFELQDYIDVDSLLRDFLRSLGLRYGQFQSRHVTMHPFAQGLRQADGWDRTRDRLVTHLKGVLREYRVDPSTVVVMLCGRDSYGNCSGMTTATWKNQSEEFSRLHLFIEVLGKVGIPTVYFPSTQERAHRKLAMIGKYEVQLDFRVNEDPRPASQVDQADWAWPSDPWVNVPKQWRSGPLEQVAQDMSVFPGIIAGALQDFFEVEEADQQFVLKPEKGGLSSEAINRLEFIYALTLFRHSRPRDAMSSEATFHCPHRFQANALDNDFLRATRVAAWISELRKQRVFFAKPGGALWMHRDIRLAIRSILEQVDIQKVVEKYGHAEETPSRVNRHLLEIRGRLHFWIGDWYYKAFCASGHLAPILESVHHLLSSAVYARFAKPKTKKDTPIDLESVKTYQRMMFESAVVQASKVLLSSWSWIELWQASSADVAWLSTPHATQIEKVLSRSIAAIVPEEDSDASSKRLRMEDAIKQFKRVQLALGRAVKLEGGNIERGAWRNATPDDVHLDLIHGKGPPPGFDEKEDDISKPLLAYGVEAIRRPDAANGTMARTLNRNVEAAMGQCGQGFVEVWENLRQIAAGAQTARDEFGKIKARWKQDASPPVLRRAIWVLGETAYLMLRRAKIKFHANGTISNEEWLLSTMSCNLGIDLCKHLPAWMLGYEMQSKVKLHTIYSLALANLGRFYESNRHLNEAQALLSKRKDTSSRDLAVISLRRAEVKLTECFWIGRFLHEDTAITPIHTVECGPKGDSRITFVMPVENIGPKRCWHTGELQSRRRSTDEAFPVLPPNIFECYRLAKPIGFKGDYQVWQVESANRLRALFSAKLDEAVRALDIAERNLGGSSQSNLWWSRLRTLRLRVYGLLQHLHEDADISIIFRKHAPDFGIFSTFQAAVRIAGEDDFRKLRALKYFLSANRWYCGFMKGDHQGDQEINETNGWDRDLRIYLPDSMEIATAVGNDLKSSVFAYRSGPGDLLKQATTRCFDHHPELGIDTSDLVQ